MNEPLFLNNHKVNRLSKKALVRANQEPDPNSLYLLQLMSWSLESGTLIARDNRLQDQVIEMTAWEPKEVMSLMGTEPGSSQKVQILNSPNPEKLSPKELAADLLETLSACLIETLPTYLDKA